MANYMWFSPDTGASMISSSDGWDDLTIFPVGSGFATGPYYFTNNGNGLDTYPDADINNYAVKKDISPGAAGKPSAQNGYLTVGTGFKGYGKHIDTIYQQEFFCKGKVTVANNDTPSSDEDLELIKKWFSVTKLKEIVAMDDSNPDKVIKSDETLLDVVEKNQGKKTICGGKSSVACSSYTGTFDQDHMYYVTLSQTKTDKKKGDWTEYMTYPATARVTTQDGGNSILIVDLTDAANYYVVKKKDNSGYESCYKYWVQGTTNPFLTASCDNAGVNTIHRIVAEPLE